MVNCFNVLNSSAFLVGTALAFAVSTLCDLAVPSKRRDVYFSAPQILGLIA